MASTSHETPLNDEGKWRSRAVERSIEATRAKAADRSDRLFSAAYQLLQEFGSDFSVQDVVNRSKTTLRFFYQSFGGKDELLLAIYEEAMISGLARQVEAADAVGVDPVDRLRAFLLAEWSELDAAAPMVNRALTLYHQRLAETRPADLATVLRPQHDALTDLVKACRKAGRVRNKLSDAANAAMLVHLLTTCLQARVMNLQVGGQDVSGAMLWSFVVATFAPNR